MSVVLPANLGSVTATAISAILSIGPLSFTRIHYSAVSDSEIMPRSPAANSSSVHMLTSIKPMTPKILKSLLVFSCSPLVGTKNRFGRYYDRCVARDMRHNKALKAVARKRLRVIYAVMRDRVPYIEPSAGGDAGKSASAAWQNYRDTLSVKRRNIPSSHSNSEDTQCSTGNDLQSHIEMHRRENTRRARLDDY